ncbi:Fibronectin type III [Penicillium chermesinum]|uniref:Fibronectin type III n=1 Tax=Penicillium chermesinum TaxID=63820 RepID=A0A9W9TYJ0_9EURO|nr:Fibronectin type III [Penicillium chermesinum]KAJ5249183.1 Fibronectin type III [Penicillium chermesinum]
MLVSLTVGKVDAGVAVLLTHDNRLIEFPSFLLPNNISSGSIVDINVARNHAAEAANATAFQTLQKRILNKYGVKAPSPPVLRLRNATQTSLVLEWDPIDLATASLKSLSLYRNNSKAGSIPRPLETRSTKISGLAIHTEYTFHLSEKLTCRTHKMTDLSGITVTAGVLDPARKEALGAALDRIGGKLIDTVRIDTTHFVCSEGRGPQWEKAVASNIPVVVPEWVDACESEGTIVGVRGYYLNADPKARQLGVMHGSSHQRTTSTVSLHSTATGRPSTQPQAAEPVPEQRQQAPEQPPEQLPEPPLTPFPGGETSSQPQAQEEEVGSEDEEEAVPPPPPKDAGESDADKPKPNGDLHAPEQNGETGETESSDEEGNTHEGTLPQNRPDEAEQPSDTSSKGKGKEGESDFNEVPL